jgi:hypothetical protein
MVQQSILNSTKKVVGLSETDTSFDLDILLHINSVFSVLNQIGIGPVEGFMVEDSAVTWDTFMGNDPRLNSVKTYVYLRVRLLFDPPNTSFVIESMNKQIAEFEWRLNVQREDEEWTNPFLTPSD